LTSISNYQFLVISAFSYLAFIIFSISFFDFAIPLDSRILAPFSILTIIALVSIIYKCLKQYNTLFIPAFVLLSLIYVAGNIKKSYIFWEKYRLEGDGFNCNKYDSLEFPVALQTPNRLIFSDHYTFLKYKTPHLCDKIKPMPLDYIEINNTFNPDFERCLKDILTLIEKDSAIIVMFNSDNHNKKQRNDRILQLARQYKKLELKSSRDFSWIE
jgi:hypothetical protein